MTVDRALGPAQYLRARMEDPEIRALMERVSIEPDPDLDPTVVGEVQARRVERAVTDLAAQPNVAELVNSMTIS
jgi:2-methylcitrate dehydratase PrpD